MGLRVCRNVTACKSFAAGRGLLSLPLHRSRKTAHPLPVDSGGSLPSGASWKFDTTKTTRSIFMLFLSYAYRFLSNFVFLALVYFA